MTELRSRFGLHDRFRLKVSNCWVRLPARSAAKRFGSTHQRFRVESNIRFQDLRIALNDSKNVIKVMRDARLTARSHPSFAPGATAPRAFCVRSIERSGSQGWRTFQHVILRLTCPDAEESTTPRISPLRRNGKAKPQCNPALAAADCAKKVPSAVTSGIHAVGRSSNPQEGRFRPKHIC